MASNPNKYISIKEASKYLGIPLRTVYRLVAQGKITSVRFGGKIKCLFSAVEQCGNYGTESSSQDTEKTGRFKTRESAGINTNFTCSYTTILPPLKNVTGEGIITNLSANGIFLIHKKGAVKEINVNDPVNLNFLLNMENNKSVDIAVKGRVLRKTKTSLAIKFRFIDEKIKAMILRYIG